MIVYDATKAQVRRAVQVVNSLADTDNLALARCDDCSNSRGPRVRFTLTVNDSRGRFGRLSPPRPPEGRQRRIKAACWHAHGAVFEALLAIAPSCRIVTAGREVTARGGNWQDWNIGSQVYPFWYSEACECRGW